MTYKLLAAVAALSFGLSSAVAMAQTDPAQTDPAQTDPAQADPAQSGNADDTAVTRGQLPAGWAGPIADAFFANEQLSVLRARNDIQTNWEMLSDEQQAQVRADCATVDTAANQTDDDMTTSSTTPDNAVTAAVERVCEMVGGM